MCKQEFANANQLFRPVKDNINSWPFLNFKSLNFIKEFVIKSENFYLKNLP